MPKSISQQALELIEATLDFSDEERDAQIEVVCADNLALRQEVESLLQRDRPVPENFMAAPNAGSRSLPPVVDGEPPETAHDDWLIGRTLAGFRIDRVIGSGGMGTVYLAEQDRPKRSVALKVLRPGWLSTSAARRFDHEANILGRLRHPNIAQVFEVGMLEDQTGHRSLPYFAMEYVSDAQSIIARAEDRRFNTQARLELFLAVCDAVAHAHHRGVIHRDLKPSNILIDEGGHAKVIDFGVARVTDADVAITTMHTEVGQLMGTLQYMSPEQCAADPLEIDTRTDVYALGVTLFELMCGHRPYDLANLTLHAAARVICERPPALPSSFRRTLRGDLETILLKALEKDPACRYQSAQELAGDIRRFLSREPIEARPISVWNRFTRWIGRHPYTTTAIGCLALLGCMLGGGLLANWRYIRQPANIVLDGLTQARLLNRLNGELCKWEVDPPATIHCATLLGSTVRSGGSDLALVGFNNDRSESPASRLAWYNLGSDPSVPVGIDRIENSQVPAEFAERGVNGNDFAPMRIWQFDLFDEEPGVEVLVAWHHEPGAFVVLRVYSQPGEPVFQLWHNGPIRCCHWMEGPGVLVCAGLNADCKWGMRGSLDVPNSHPRIVFGVKPEHGKLSTKVIRDSGSKQDLGVEWYRCLLPPKLAGTVNWSSAKHPLKQFDPATAVKLAVSPVGNEDLGAWFTLNSDGDEIPSGRGINTNWSTGEGEPDPAGLYFGNLPPVIDPDSNVESNESSVESD